MRSEWTSGFHAESIYHLFSVGLWVFLIKKLIGLINIVFLVSYLCLSAVPSLLQLISWPSWFSNCYDLLRNDRYMDRYMHFLGKLFKVVFCQLFLCCINRPELTWCVSWFTRDSSVTLKRLLISCQVNQINFNDVRGGIPSGDSIHTEAAVS